MCDSVSAFGGIVGANRIITRELAEAMEGTFYEAIIAPGFEDDALPTLRQRKNLEILAVPNFAIVGSRHRKIEPGVHDYKRVAGGMLVQTPDDSAVDEGNFKVVTDRSPTLEELTDLLFGWRCVKHVTSNAIVLAKGLVTVGIGPGQVSRVVAVETAVRKAGENARLAVMASDAYFAFPGGIVREKIGPAEDVLAADRLVAARAPGVSLVASIESAKGLLNAPAIAATSAHVSGLMFGAEDWASDLGLPAGREGEGRELLYPRSAVVVAATAAGILAFDSVWPDIRDLPGLRHDSLLARRLGFSRKTSGHPDQIAAVNEAFTPSDAEAARARGIVAAFEEATRRGAGVTEFEGQLVDRPVVERALRALRAWDL